MKESILDQIKFEYMGGEHGIDGGITKSKAVVNGHDLCKEIANYNGKRKVSYYWEELKPVYSTIEECLLNPPNQGQGHADDRERRRRNDK